MAKQKWSFGEVLVAQWPGVIGLGCIGLGLGMVWYAKNYPPHVLFIRPVVVLIAVGTAFLGYWALANNNSDYNM